MRVFQRVRNYPAIILCAAVTGLAGWVAYDLLTPAGSPPPSERSELVVPPVVIRTPVEDLLARRQQPSATLLPKLKVGMTRVEVETVLGPPGPGDILPITADADGRLTYCTSYELADPAPPPTVRPLMSGHTRSPAPPPVLELRLLKSFVALEFDATRPGHPLVKIHYLDPLF